MKKLSILVPQYNETDEVVEPLLQSIYMQQGIDFNDIEVIIINDGSDIHLKTKNLNKFRKKFKIRYIMYDKNVGVSETRNRLLDFSEGEYIQYCDADDMFSNLLGLRMIFQEIDKSHFDAMFSPFVEEVLDRKTGINEFDIRNLEATFVHGKVIRKQFLIDNNIRWNKNLRLHEDSYFNTLVYRICKPEKFVMAKVPFYLYKWRDNSVVRSDPNFKLKTYKQYLMSSKALIDEFVARRMYLEAKKYSLAMTFNLFYSVQQEDWQKTENQKAVEDIERYFKPIYLEVVDLMDDLNALTQLKLVKQIRNNFYNEGVLLESISFTDWLERLLSR